MNISAPFIARPVATTLLTLAIAIAGVLGFSKLPVSPLPQVDFPTITVIAQLPGASPNTVATSVAEPLERHLGQIADVTEMTSQSGIGQTRITLQFDVSRDIDGAARDVQAAINAARADLPTNLVTNPTYRKTNPADAPILILALTSKTFTQGQMYDAASNVLAQRLSQRRVNPGRDLANKCRKRCFPMWHGLWRVPVRPAYPIRSQDIRRAGRESRRRAVFRRLLSSVIIYQPWLKATLGGRLRLMCRPG